MFGAGKLLSCKLPVLYKYNLIFLFIFIQCLVLSAYSVLTDSLCVGNEFLLITHLSNFLDNDIAKAYVDFAPQSQ